MVCLVLSGGGARGAAHIGVIRVLEEYRVPIDCITGTSMGSLVGAGYASGMTVPEMEKLTEKITFDLLFKEVPPRRELTIRRKQDELRLNLFSPEIGVNDRGDVGFAKGVVSGVQLETVLRELSRIKGYIEFDKLPIPFRAVATDLVTGKPKIFDRGDLALAMRASMSVPGIIAPAEFDDMMLVDGGLVNNLPVDVARSMGADVVIAVNLGTPLAKREDIKNVLGITGQMIGILTEQNVQQTLATLKSTDILILPELGNYSAGDFDNMRSTFAIGEAAARKVADRLAALSLPADRYAQFQSQRTKTIVATTRPVDEIRFEPRPKRVNPEFMATLIESKAGEPFDQATLDADLLRLYGTRDFEHVSYRLLETPAKQILNIQGVEKSWGPNFLRFGLGLSSDFSGNAFFNLQAQYRRTWINSYGGEWYNDVALGRNTAWYSEFYQPLDARQRFFVAPYLDLERRFLDVFVGDTPTSEYSLPTAIAGLDFGTQFTRYGEVRARPLRRRDQAQAQFRQCADRRRAVRRRSPACACAATSTSSTASTSRRTGGPATSRWSRGIEALGSDFDYDRWEGVAGVREELRPPHAESRDARLGADLGGPLPRVRLDAVGRVPAAVRVPDRAVAERALPLRPPDLQLPPAHGAAVRRALRRGLGGGGRLRPAARRGQSDRHAVFGRGVPRLRQPARTDVPGLWDGHGWQQRGVLLSRAALTTGIEARRRGRTAERAVQSSHSIGRIDIISTPVRLTQLVPGSVSWRTSPEGVRSIHSRLRPSGPRRTS